MSSIVCLVDKNGIDFFNSGDLHKKLSVLGCFEEPNLVPTSKFEILPFCVVFLVIGRIVVGMGCGCIDL